ncbi:MAG: hypothetical protein H0U74_23640 [Bradymonadaceae bacterium]|nr:hypothetical protein [Lujinxingiaceae bacterium]
MNFQEAARHRCWLALLASTMIFSSCLDDSGPVGLRIAAPTGGPKVLFDVDVRPFPEIPFPNDIATRIDPASPTGKRVNISRLGATHAEERVRLYINRMSGFGLFSPLSVAFDAPLDIENIIARHHEDVPDFSDDAVYLVNIDRKSPDFGKLELLDLGRGNFPITLARPNGYFVNDSRAMGTNLLFESGTEAPFEVEGVFDPMADSNDDGIQGVPNTRTPGGDPYEPGQMLDFYERETNTLIMRPVHPLAQGTTYAVVLTRALRGANGLPVDSPFDFVNHTNQTSDLEPLREILPAKLPERFGPDLRDVRFAWSFTTQVATEELEAVRAGLYGHGSLKWLGERFPAELHTIHNAKKPGADEPMTLDLSSLLALIIPIAAQEAGPEGARVIEESFKNIEYMVSGSFLSPNFLADKSGLGAKGLAAALADANLLEDDESFWIDLENGEAHVGASEVPFICMVPKARPGRAAPFPVIIYSHAIGSTRLEILVFAGAMAKFGLATCTIDAVGHGLSIPPEYQVAVERVAASRGIPNLKGVLEHHRARDLTNDGMADTGGDYFTSDLLHSRDMIRQTTIDQMQFVRILRSFDGKRLFPDTIDESDPYVIARRAIISDWDHSGNGRSEIAGDFNGDGTVDFGGERAYLAWGTSLGGLQTGVLAGIEPTIRAAVSNAGGGGLADIALRTTISNVRAGVVLRMVGPALVGRPYVNQRGERTGQMRLEWLLATAERDALVHFGDIDLLEDGDRVVLRNLVREKNHLIPEDERQSYALVRGGGFRVSVATDAEPGTMRRARMGFNPKISAFDTLMGCAVARRCNDVECPNNNYCAADGTCKPQGQCLRSFDPASVEDSEHARELRLRTADNPRIYGDPLVIEIYDAGGQLKQTIDTFPQNLIFQNIVYPAGAPLAALMQGWGLKRQTPRFRSFIGIAQTLLEVADPAVYAPHYFLRPLKYPYETPAFREGGTNFVAVGTLGDQTVPISTALAMARSAGVLDTLEFDERYGTTQNDFLIKNFVYEGIHWLNRFPSHPNTLFDPDNLDEGRFRLPGQPDNDDVKPTTDKPLRATVTTPYGISGLRLPYLTTYGEHTFNAPRPTAAFDINTFMTNQVGWYLVTGGQELRDDHCFEKMAMPDCSFFNLEDFQRPTL